MIVSQSQVDKFYGHSHLIALKARGGWLCHRWHAASVVAIVLFSDAKLAREWLKTLRAISPDGQGEIFSAIFPQPLASHPTDLVASINPANDAIEISRLLGRLEWRDF